MTSPALDLILRGTPRARFLRELGVLLVDPRLVWLASSAEALTAIDSSPDRRVITHSAAPGARLSAQGIGYGLSFNGTDQYASTPDATSLSFGDGTTDQAFSIVAVANVTDTAAERVILSKFDLGGGAREYYLSVSSTDQLSLRLCDQSAAVVCSRLSDAPITQGSFVLLGASYSGVGGASAANGITLYQNGALIASTATNNASYVAMENLTVTLDIGTVNSHSAFWFSGSIAMVALCARNLTAADHAAIYALCRRYFGI